MLTFSQYNRKISGQSCCCKGDQGAQGAQGSQGAQGAQGAAADGSWNVMAGANQTHINSTTGYDQVNFDVLSFGTVGTNGYNIIEGTNNHFNALPFGGDTSNNAPLDASDNPIQFNQSTWLKIELTDEQWTDISFVKPANNFAYIPIYWKS
jgi:hypothetical protein